MRVRVRGRVSVRVRVRVRVRVTVRVTSVQPRVVQARPLCMSGSTLGAGVAP